MKHSHSSLDAQTISTFDSSNGDNPGFYHKYASAWSQLQSSAVLHSGSYKPTNLSNRFASEIPYENHHFGQGRHRSSPNECSINEALRESICDPIDNLNRRNSSLLANIGVGFAAKKNSDLEWQHSNRAKSSR